MICNCVAYHLRILPPISSTCGASNEESVLFMDVICTCSYVFPRENELIFTFCRAVNRPYWFDIKNVLQDITSTVEDIKAEIVTTIDDLNKDANSIIANTAKLVSRQT